MALIANHVTFDWLADWWQPAVTVHAGRMAASKVGGGNADAGAATKVHRRRTSTSMLLDDATVAATPQWQPLVEGLRLASQAVLGASMPKLASLVGYARLT